MVGAEHDGPTPSLQLPQLLACLRIPPRHPCAARCGVPITSSWSSRRIVWRCTSKSQTHSTERGNLSAEFVQGLVSLFLRLVVLATDKPCSKTSRPSPLRQKKRRYLQRVVNKNRKTYVGASPRLQTPRGFPAENFRSTPLLKLRREENTY